MKRVIDRGSVAEQVSAHGEQGAAEKTADRFYIRSGLTMLNLALSDRRKGGFLGGSVANLIGDSSSGKTFVALGLLAEAANDPRLDEYDLVHDDPERGNNFDVQTLFGEKAFGRISPPGRDDDGNPKHSETVDDFQANVRSRLKAGKPFIYVLDSLDSIYAEEEAEHADDVEKAKAAGKEVKGSYGMQKAKAMSIMLRLLVSGVAKTKSLLIIVSQTRANIDPMSFVKVTRAGGKALEFYCNYEMWTAIKTRLHEEVGKKKRKVNIGVQCLMKIRKCRGTGKTRTIEFPVLYNLGPDDIGSCVDFLTEEEVFKKKSGSIDASALQPDLKGFRSKLIAAIEEDTSLVSALHKLTASTWRSLEDEIAEKNQRKARYA